MYSEVVDAKDDVDNTLCWVGKHRNWSLQFSVMCNCLPSRTWSILFVKLDSNLARSGFYSVFKFYSSLLWYPQIYNATVLLHCLSFPYSFSEKLYSVSMRNPSWVKTRSMLPILMKSINGSIWSTSVVWEADLNCKLKRTFHENYSFAGCYKNMDIWEDTHILQMPVSNRHGTHLLYSVPFHSCEQGI